MEDADTGEGAWVAVVSTSFVERYWPGQDPIGKTFRHRGRLRTVVGVVGDIAPGDPGTFAAAINVALLTTVAGSVVPALRALHVSPMSVLRAE